MRDYSFGNFLCEQRMRRGLSQFQLGRLVGVSDKAVSKWENGASKPRSATLFRLSTVLEISADELLACRYQDAPTERKGLFAMKNEIEMQLREQFRVRYGDTPPLVLQDRFEEEWMRLQDSDYLLLFDYLAKLHALAQEQNEQIIPRGCIGASFLAYLMGVCDLNPLPPHYICPVCKRYEAVPGASDGWDLPKKMCACGHPMIGDGHRAAFETLYRDMQTRAMPEISVSSRLLPAAEKLFREVFSDFRVERLALEECADIPMLMVLPDEIAAPRLLLRKDYLKLVRLGFGVRFIPCEWLEKLPALAERSGRAVSAVPYRDRALIGAFAAMDTAGIPDYDCSKEESKRMRTVLAAMPPENFYDLFRTSGYAHGTWSYDEEDRMCRGRHAFRDEVFYDICGDMALRGYALSVMRQTCMRRGIAPAVQRGLEMLGFDARFIGELRDIWYLFPKAHALGYVKLALIMMWYKRNAPAVFAEVTGI
ncbi:MAG: helix-turn-helix domain-containing protein [Oscillospiraceae bacterium]|nr:helix-turn-helix domain-containing protein [Oscillospiraceae bacterium]